VVDMYLAGERVVDIAEVTGTTSIYFILRRAGIEPGRTSRRRDPQHRALRRERSVDALTLVAGDLGVSTLGITQYRSWRRDHPELGLLSDGQIRRVFDGWNGALQAAGLARPVAISKREIDFDAAVEWLQQAAQGALKLTRAQYRDWQAVNDHARPIYHLDAHFKWSELVEKAGLVHQVPQGHFTAEEISSAVHAAAKEHPRLTTEAYGKWRARQSGQPLPSRARICKGGKKWNEVLEAHGIAPISTKRFTDDEISAALKQAWDGTGPLTVQTYVRWRANQPDQLPSSAVITSRHGTWRKALEVHGIH